jgi:hypothetical protein
MDSDAKPPVRKKEATLPSYTFSMKIGEIQTEHRNLGFKLHLIFKPSVLA